MSNPELDRISELRRYPILDTLPEPRFDRITSLAARLFDAPIALISLVDEHRQWFKSRHGTPMPESAREISFCTHAIQSEQVMVVLDAARDPRFADSPLVTGEPHIRFYAGAPLITAAGFRLGALCVIDRAPREPLAAEQLANLTDLAAMVVDEMELRLAERTGTETQKLLGSVFEAAAAGISVTDEQGRFVQVNPAHCRLLGYTAAEMIGRPFYEFLSQGLADQGFAAHAAFLTAGAEMPTQWSMRRKNGTAVDVYISSSRMILDDGRKFRVASVTDLTEIKRAEQALRESHQRFMHILESITDGFFTLDRDWRFVYLNPEAERLLGANLIGKSLTEHLDDLTLQQILRQATERREPGHCETFSSRLNSWNEVHVYPGPDTLSVYFRDVTQRRRAFRAYREFALG